MMKKLMFLGLVMFLLFAGAASAQIDLDFKEIGKKTLEFGKKLGNIEEIYDKNPRTWDFVIFTLIFGLVGWLGLSKWFGETNKGAAVVLALVFGVLLGLGALKAEMSVKIVIPFVKNAFFFVVAGIIFFILIKTEAMKDHKIISALIALVVTFIIFNLGGLVGGIDSKGWFEGGRTSQSLDLEEINEELDNLAKKYNVSKYNVTNKSEVEKLKLKLDMITKAIEAAIQDKEKEIRAKKKEVKAAKDIDKILKEEELADFEKNLEVMKDDLEYAKELWQAGDVMAKKDEALMKEMEAVEKDAKTLLAKIEEYKRTGATDEEKKQLKEDLANLVKKLEALKKKNEE